MKLYALLLIAASVLWFSCTKDRDDSMYHYLPGTWKMTHMGADANGNNLLESAELMELPQNSSMTTTFHADRTGFGAMNMGGGMSMNTKFMWTTNERAQMLLLHTEDSAMLQCRFRAQDFNHFSLLTENRDLMGNKLWMAYARQ